ncbi:MAG: hypothetical protein QM692_24065 [Thermomicrobiales bacterium]
MTRQRTPFWRRALSILLLLLCCLAAPVALVTGWARSVILDQNTYVRTVTPIANDAELQTLLADAVTDRIVTEAVGDASSATQAILARALRDVVGSATREVVASPEFANAWVQANTEVYQLLAAGIQSGWGQPVILDLSPLAGAIQAQIDAASEVLPLEISISPDDLRLEVLDAQTADSVRRVLDQLQIAFWAALAAAIGAAVLSVALAGNRLGALARLAFGLAVAMAVLMAALLLSRGWAAGQTGSEAGAVAVQAIMDAISQGLRQATIVIAAAGLLLAALFAGLSALRGNPAATQG